MKSYGGHSFCIFILSHGRADKVVTLDSLNRCGYTGEWYIVCDDEDDTLEEYKERFGDRVLVFSKEEMQKRFDDGDRGEDRRVIVYARNVCFDLAELKGVECFLELDDDYTDFMHRYMEFGKYKGCSTRRMDDVIELYVRWLYSTDSVTVAFAQGGDFIGGKDNARVRSGVMRKAMNSFFCRTDKRFWFVGRINEDVNTYVTLGSRGELVQTAVQFMLTQMQTQKNKGGMSDIYLDNGTFLKSFFSVMYAPSCVKVSMMGDKHTRIHHKVMWNKAVPKIIREEYRKCCDG